MNKILISLFVSLVIAIDACGQKGVYVLEEDDKISITLSDGYYAIDVDVSFDDVISYERLSFGQYESIGKTIQLKDVLLNYYMEIVLADPHTLLFVKGFHSLIGKPFKFERMTNITKEYWSKVDDDFDGYMKDNCIHWESGTTFTCDTGWYVLMNCRHNTDIHLIGNKRFNLTINDSVYLSGTWIQEGNMLVFIDDIITEHFYAVIVEDGIIPFMPNILGLWTYNLYDEKRKPFQTE